MTNATPTEPGAAEDEPDRNPLAGGSLDSSALFEFIPDALLIADHDGRIVHVNRHLQDMFGYSSDELRGKPLEILMPERFRASHADKVARYRVAPRRRPMGSRVALFGQRRDGIEFPVEIELGPILAPDGTMTIAAIRDVTERKYLEANLVRAQRLEAVGRLTGGVAHDFNNLLAVVLGWLQVIDDEIGGVPQLRERVRACMRAVRRGTALTRSLLAFARQQPLAPSEIDLNAIIGDMIEMVRKAVGPSIDVKVVQSEDLWRCEADPGQFQNALINLALNARDAMPTGGTLLIETANERLAADDMGGHLDAMPGDYAMLSVTDTGVGMPPEIVERAFEPFFSTKEPGKGSGLGLSMVYGFANQSGGHVVITSEVGRGTSVHLCLPRKMETRPRVWVAAEDRTAPAPGTETILVVEGDDDIRELVTMQLAKFGYAVLSANTADQALQIVRNHPDVALLLTDMMPPGELSGPRIAERARVVLPQLKVLFMTGYGEDHFSADAPAAQWPGVLHKPFRGRDLAAAVRAALDADSGRA